MKLTKQSIAILLLIAAVFGFNSCMQNTEKMPLPDDSEIREIWDNGTPRTVWVFATVNGLKTAIKEIQYHANGVKSMEGPLKNNLRDGNWKSWYPDGSLWSVGSFKDGLRHGKGTVYHPNGNKFIEGTYVMGQRVGKWGWFDDAGNAISEEEALGLAPYFVEEGEDQYLEDSLLNIVVE